MNTSLIIAGDPLDVSGFQAVAYIDSLDELTGKNAAKLGKHVAV